MKEKNRVGLVEFADEETLYQLRAALGLRGKVTDHGAHRCQRWGLSPVLLTAM